MIPGASAIAAFLRRVRHAVDTGRVELTSYATDGADELGWEPLDVLDQLRELTVEEWFRCEESTAVRGDLIWVFTPNLWDEDYLWIRLVERGGIVVISFHRG
jgi:hypothetical protein